ASGVKRRATMSIPSTAGAWSVDQTTTNAPAAPQPTTALESVAVGSATTASVSSGTPAAETRRIATPMKLGSNGRYSSMLVHTTTARPVGSMQALGCVPATRPVLSWVGGPRATPSLL